MRTKFGKRLIASGLIAAIGANLVATGPAFAGPDRDRNFSRSDSGRDNGRDRDGGRNDRNDGNRGHDRGSDRGNDRDRGDRSDNRRDDHRKPAVTVVQKPVVVHRETVQHKPAVKVVERPVVVHREVVRHETAHRAPTARVDHRPQHVYYAPPVRHVVVVPERRRYRDVWVVRHHGHRYHGYGHHHLDSDAYPWLAFTAISVALIAVLSESQQRSYEDAQIRAATAPIGQSIVWNDAGAYGSVTPVREGTSSSGRYCREFQQTVTIGGRTEQAYGTACMQPDGAWEVVSQ